MAAEVFAVELRTGERGVGEIVSRLRLAQPVVSKQLRVLRLSGFVTCRRAAQRRI